MTKIVYALFYAISLLPFRLLYCISDFEYFMMFHVIKYRRGIVRKNLTASFPEKSAEEIAAIEKKFYRWFCDYFFEAVKLLSISDKELRRRFHVYNSEEVEKCFQEGQDVAAILGHYCNWEWLSCVGIELPKTRMMGLIYHPLYNKAFDELFKRIRSHEENGVPVPKKDILRYLVDYKRKDIRSIFGYISDQGRKWALPEHEITRRFFQMLETTIRQNPPYYLWTHNRWKRTKEEFDKRYEVVKGKVVPRES